MIERKDISDFFNLEAEENEKKWSSTMELPIEDRIRKRKAIDKVFLDKEYIKTSSDGETLYKVTAAKNLSDFKEGEPLILHKPKYKSGLKCTLYKFEGENGIIISVHPCNQTDMKGFYDTDLVLDKDLVDLRDFIYFPFISDLRCDESEWLESVINKKREPEFINKTDCKNELDETIREFGLSLTAKQKEAILKSMEAKDYYLIQGPPGTGKSYILGLIILEELLYSKHKVIVIGPNHMAINNTLGKVLELMPPYGNILKVGQSYNAPTIEISQGDETFKITNIPGINVNYIKTSDKITDLLVGLTPHSLYSRRARGLECDTLVIDEAGQMTIPLALMGMIKAKKVILAGDHKQLPPIIISDEIKEELKDSIFKALITKENCTMLDVSFRMCKTICAYVSELFYDGSIKSHKTGDSNLISCNDPMFDFSYPIIIHDIEDKGMQTSDKEAEFITETVKGYLKKGLKASEIGIISPFRAQAANIRRHIHHCKDINEEDRNAIVSETIDKMQGQEREVIIYSLTAGDPDYINEMADFLYNPNKMNVAFSRAKSKLIIVGNIKALKGINSIEYPHIPKMLKSEFAKMI